jgi:hypothetical protein
MTNVNIPQKMGYRFLDKGIKSMLATKKYTGRMYRGSYGNRTICEKYKGITLLNNG